MIGTVLRYLRMAALSVWVGGIVFFSFFTAPALFTSLPRAMAGRVTAAIFPRYYLMGTICGAIALASGVALARRARGVGRARAAGLLMLIIMLGLNLYAGEVILPAAAAARETMNDPAAPASAASAAHERFAALHRRSMIVNGAVLLLGAGVLFTLALKETGRSD